MTFKALLELDHHLSLQFRLQSNQRLLRRVAAILAHSADSWFWLAGLGFLWAFHWGEWHNKAFFLAVGIFILAVVVMFIKFTIRRQRPEGGWGKIYRTADPHSFPSGHAARAVFLAAMFWAFGPAWLALLLTVWAPLVGLARVVMGVHFLSDVLAGIVVGLVFAGLYLLVYPFLQESVFTLFPFLLVK